MKIESALEEIKQWHDKDIKAGEGDEKYDFFPKTYGVSAIAEILDRWDYTDADDKWAGKYDKPNTKMSSLLPYRDIVAFLSSAQKDILSFYLSGTDQHVMTDVDALRVGPHYYWNSRHRIDPIKTRTKEKS